MTIEKKSLPVSILILSALFALMEIMVSLSIYFSPETVIETLDIKATGVAYLTQMWAVRQFALGFIFAFATYKKSIPMLTTAYIFTLVMFVGDLSIGISQKENPLIISALVMCIVSSVILFVLNRRK